jgi:zinc transport system substrate-binding protein
VQNLTQPGKEPHDLELSVAQTAEVAEADLVVYLAGFQPAVDDAVEQNATGETLEVGGVVGLDGDDPHFWQDPLRMAAAGDAIAEQATEIDPDHADDYAANAADLRRDLEGLDAAYAAGLTGCARDTIVVTHDAFSYLGKYGVRLASIVGLSPDAEPTPADLARLQELIDAEGITTVFSETLVSPRTAESLADDMGISSDVLDPIEGLSDQTEGEDYPSLMQANLAALEKANGCSTS